MLQIFYNHSDICHQVLDLYSQANNAKTPDSPPMTPSDEPTKERSSSQSTIESASSTPNGNQYYFCKSIELGHFVTHINTIRHN